MTILVIAPHPDDESIGCGGMLCRHADNGERTVIVFLTSGELGLKHLPCEDAQRVREAEAEEAADVLGVCKLVFLRQADWFIGDNIATTADVLRPVLEADLPRRIYLPHKNEWHPDHAACRAIVREALSKLPKVRLELHSYEVWTPMAAPDLVENIAAEFSRKLRAIRCYRSQLADLRYDRAARGLNQFRGALAGYRYAEAFQAEHVAEEEHK